MFDECSCDNGIVKPMHRQCACICEVHLVCVANVAYGPVQVMIVHALQREFLHGQRKILYVCTRRRSTYQNV